MSISTLEKRSKSPRHPFSTPASFRSKISDTRYDTERRPKANAAKRAKMDDKTLTGSGRSLQTSPSSTSTMTAPRTVLSGATDALGSRRPLNVLADLIAELKRDNDMHADERAYWHGGNQAMAYSADDNPQQVGAGLFYDFEKRIETLDKQLRAFENASRELGGSVGIVSSAFRFQERLAKILFLFRENAASLYPREISRKPQEALINPNVMERRLDDWRNRSTVPQLQGTLELDMFPLQLENLAKDVGAFTSCLNEFEEFNDEAITHSMRAFEGDLRYFSSCLFEYKQQFRSPAVQRYIHDLMFEIGGHLDEVTAALDIFIEIGIPTIWFHQQHAAKNLMNVSTLSIVFGAVNATLLVGSHKSTNTVLAKSVTILWMASLIFSIAGGVNGLLGLTWKQSVYRSPVHRVPWWLLVWMKGSPLVFLVTAIACFSTGVVLFTYSSRQNPITSAIIVSTTLIASSGFICISGWFFLERWTFLVREDQKWLAEVISEVLENLSRLGAVRWYRLAIQWCGRRLAATLASIARFFSWLAETRDFDRIKGVVMNADVDSSDSTRLPSISSEPHVSPNIHEHKRSNHLLLNVRDPRIRFRNAIRAVIELQRTTRKRPAPLRPGLPRRDSWWQTKTSSPPETSANPVQDIGLYALRSAKVAKAVDGLKALEFGQELFPHCGLVRHVEFSPDGRYFATAGWDRTAVIFRVRETLVHHRTLVHVRGFVNQVAWSPNGRYLVTRFTRGLKLWSHDGVCKQTIDRPKPVSSVVWLPSGQAILSVEGSDVVKLDPNGKVLDVYNLGHVRLVNVAVTSDSSRLIAIGPSIPQEGRPQPTSQAKVEKKMIVYNMTTKRRESQTPLYDDLRDVAIPKRTAVVLISFEEAAPQLWKLDIRTRTDAERSVTGRLNLKNTYALNATTRIAGSCYFGGREEQFVFCVGKAGDVHIWDRETAALLRYLRPMNMPELRDMTCVAWNNGTDAPMMFATGSHDGTVRVWSTAVARRFVTESPAERGGDSDD